MYGWTQLKVTWLGAVPWLRLTALVVFVVVGFDGLTAKTSKPTQDHSTVLIVFA